MRKIRIYQPGNYKVGDKIELSAGAGMHVGVVLRMKPLDEINLFCGDNREFLSTIFSVKKHRVIVIINEIQEVSRESSRQIHLAQAISKGDKMELVIQKAVELGVSSITPIFTQFCAVKWDATRRAKKHLQWQDIIISACEQSGRNQLPILHEACTLNDYLKKATATLKLILHPAAFKSLRDYTLSSGSLALLIGPEGGFSEDDLANADAHLFQPLCLGPRILRTETAAIAALSIIQAFTGDM